MEQNAEIDADVRPSFTDRQATAWRDDVVPVLSHHGIPKDPANWSIHWHEETRKGRGHYVNATFLDGEHFAQVLMDVYGYPSISVAALDWIHADSDEELECETCPIPPG